MQGWEASSRSCEKAGAKLGFQESQALIRLKQERRGWNGRWQSRFKMSGMLGRLEVISEKLTSKIPNYRSCARRRKMQEMIRIEEGKAVVASSSTGMKRERGFMPAGGAPGMLQMWRRAEGV